MLFRIGFKEEPELLASPSDSSEDAGPKDEDLDEVELRRQMYERIALGNALAEIEEDAHRKWRSN